MVERPATEQHVERPALERAERAARETLRQKLSKRGARAFGPAFGMAIDQHGGVHRAGRGAGNAVDLQPGLLEQAIENAPGKGAVRAAALQREIDENGIEVGGCLGLVGYHRRGTPAWTAGHVSRVL